MTSTPDAPVRTVSLAIGEVVGEAAKRWEVLRHIAEGGFSSVYAVRPATPETQEAYGTADRALKCVQGTDEEITQVRDEAERIAEVEGHENVLGLITSLRIHSPAAGDDPATAGSLGLILELADEDLYGFARRMRPGEQAWAGIFEQIAAGLEHIHARRVVHGDIKPTNMLRIDAAFKIADFGVSVPADGLAPTSSLLARTLAYLPPESCAGVAHIATDSAGQRAPNGERKITGPDQVRVTGSRQVDQGQATNGSAAREGASPRQRSPDWVPSYASDVWALAVSMHRMLTGRHITAGVTPQQQYELVCQARYSVDDRVSPGWRQLFADCLAHRPEDRSVTSAAELRRRLAELAIPEDYVGVPWLPGAPRLVAVLSPDPGLRSKDTRALVLYLTRPGGRVHGTFAEPDDDVLLEAIRHLHETAVPALAQQVRDAQRGAVRAAEERDKLQQEFGRIAASGPSTEIMDKSAPTEQIKRLSAEVTTAIRQRDELTRERDRLAREQFALARRVEQLEREPVWPVTPTHGYDYQAYQQRSRGRSALGCFFVVALALVIALSIALLVGSGLAGDPPQDVLNHVVNRISDAIDRL